MNDHVRCPDCGQRLIIVEYGDWAVWVRRDDRMVRKSEDRLFDPDWVLARHTRREHS